MKALELPPAADLGRLYHGFYEDFQYESGRWTTIASDAGGSNILDQVGGVMELDASDATVADNDEVYIHTAEVFLFASGAPLIAEAYIKFIEANTDDANILFGLMDGIAANHLLDNGGGPAASYAGAVFFKVDGSTYWQAESSDGATQKTTLLDGTQPVMQGSNATGEAQTAGGAWQRLTIDWRPKSSSRADVAYFIDGVLVAKHVDFTYANATEMAVVAGVKNGGANEEKLDLDYVFAYQKRA